jgi:ABC-2 type transport system permease protein
MFERIRTMLVKEFLQLFRDPRMRMLIFAAPMIQLLVFGYAATTDVRLVATAVFDLDNTPASRELIDRFLGSGYFRRVEQVDTEARMQDLLDHGSVRAVIRIHKGFSEDLKARRTASIQMIVDGTDSNTAGIVLNYAGQIAARYSQDILVSRWDHLLGAAPRPGQIRLQERAWFNENLESRNYYVPGVMANIIMLITLTLTGMAVIREYEIGTMEQILVTPIRPTEFILGKSLPFVLIGYVDVLLVTAVCVFWFKVPIRGSFLFLLAATALYLLPSIGLGLLVSTICKTQQQAMMSTFFLFFPAMMLSGFIFPIANMPTVIQWLTLINPLRYFLIIIRGIFLKGIGPEILWPQMAALAVLGVATLWLAVRRFHKTLA